MRIPPQDQSLPWYSNRSWSLRFCGQNFRQLQQAMYPGLLYLIFSILFLIMALAARRANPVSRPPYSFAMTVVGISMAVILGAAFFNCEVLRN